MIRKLLTKISSKNKIKQDPLKINFSNQLNDGHHSIKNDRNSLKLKNIFNFKNIDEKDFVDMPAAEPNVIFPLPRVGITNRKHKIKIRDIFNEKKIIDVEADIKIYFDLPSKQRGLHMSRIEKAMQQFQDLNLELRSYSSNLIKYAADLQNRNTGEIEIEFYYEKLTNKNFSGRPAHEILKVYLQTNLKDNNKIIHKVGLSVPFINACPCPQRWAIREFYHRLKSLNFSDEEIYNLASMTNFGTHTNLGEAKIVIEDLKNNLTYEDLYNILEESVLIVRELLSGKDEFEFIKSALIKEQFCEDSAREIIKKLIEKLNNKLNSLSFIEILVEVNESIHFHNLRVEIKDNFGNIIKNFKSQ